jgi:hypothetical protein
MFFFQALYHLVAEKMIISLGRLLKKYMILNPTSPNNPRLLCVSTEEIDNWKLLNPKYCITIDKLSETHIKRGEKYTCTEKLALKFPWFFSEKLIET